MKCRTKSLISLILIFLGLMCFGCTAAMPVKQADMTYQKVIEMPEKPAHLIYEKSKQWIALNFKSAKAVIEYDNKAEGVIIGNGSIARPTSAVNITGTGLITFTMREDIKEGKARLTFDRLTARVMPSYNTLTGPLQGGEYPILHADLEGMRANFDTFAIELQKYVLSETNGNW